MQAKQHTSPNFEHRSKDYFVPGIKASIPFKQTVGSLLKSEKATLQAGHQNSNSNSLHELKLALQHMLCHKCMLDNLNCLMLSEIRRLGACMRGLQINPRKNFTSLTEIHDMRNIAFAKIQIYQRKLNSSKHMHTMYSSQRNHRSKTKFRTSDYDRINRNALHKTTSTSRSLLNAGNSLPVCKDYV